MPNNSLTNTTSQEHWREYFNGNANRSWEGEAPAEPKLIQNTLGRSLGPPHRDGKSSEAPCNQKTCTRASLARAGTGCSPAIHGRMAQIV